MKYVNGILALVLGALALLHVDESDRLLWVSFYGAGALLAAMACKPRITPLALRVLATAATVTMFFYFAGFLSQAPYLSVGWYAAEANEATLALLVAGFCMVPVVSAYSCRMKAVRAPV